MPSNYRAGGWEVSPREMGSEGGPEVGMKLWGEGAESTSGESRTFYTGFQGNKLWMVGLGPAMEALEFLAKSLEGILQVIGNYAEVFSLRGGIDDQILELKCLMVRVTNLPPSPL